VRDRLIRDDFRPEELQSFYASHKSTRTPDPCLSLLLPPSKWKTPNPALTACLNQPWQQKGKILGLRLISPKAGQFPERLIWYVGTEGGRIYICAPDLSRWLFVKGDEVLLSQRGDRYGEMAAQWNAALSEGVTIEEWSP